MELPKRKKNRLHGYDYSQNGMYFVTICTHNRECILGEILSGADFHDLPRMALSDIGLEIDKSIQFIDAQYHCIDQYIIMPNHIHMLMAFDDTDRHGSLSLPKLVGQIKSFTTHKYNECHDTTHMKLWQRSYHDHIVRNELDYEKIHDYINTNTLKWEQDSLYPTQLLPTTADNPS